MQAVEKFLIDKFGSSVSYVSELSSGMFSKAYAENKIDVPHFDKRIRCYRLHIGLQGLMIAAFLKNEQDYKQIQQRLRK